MGGVGCSWTRPYRWWMALSSTGGPTDPVQSERLAGVDAADVVFALHYANRALQSLLIAQARASGLGLLEFLVLSRAAHDDGITPGEAGRALGLSTSTMTGLADRLEADGLVRRHPHPTDRRLLLLRATAKGRRLRERALGPILAKLTAEAETLQSAERVAAAAFLQRVGELVSEHAEQLQPIGRGPASASAPRGRRLPPNRSRGS